MNVCVLYVRCVCMCVRVCVCVSAGVIACVRVSRLTLTPLNLACRYGNFNNETDTVGYVSGVDGIWQPDQFDSQFFSF
jgi:hypothetical protein